MKPKRTFHVQPSLPERLQALEKISQNLRWAWDHESINLFRRMDRELFETTYHNPTMMLGTLPQRRLEGTARDEAFLANLDRVEKSLNEYMNSPTTWYKKTFEQTDQPMVAYFSMEFGITECLPIYSGGLGVLAGDHLNSASDLDIPLVGVGLLYQKGYFRQYLSPEGWQQERNPVNDFYTMPISLYRDETGQPIRISVDLAGQNVVAQLWKAQVGRVTLVLLDTNIPENPQQIQDITDELYGGDLEMRIRQEIILGIGGVRALDRLGVRASVYHMNEGHSAFLAVERIIQYMKKNSMTFTQARAMVSASTVFTTHTPVPAGIDVFPSDLVERYLGNYRQEIGLAKNAFLNLGRIHPGDEKDPFNMAVLAIRTACFTNGVSRLHGKVARQMWKDLWPGIPENELPIQYVTNGIHPQSWISVDLRYLFDRYLGPRWAEEPGDTKVWERCAQIPGEELWRMHSRRRQRLVTFTRQRLVKQLLQRGAGKAEIAAAENALDPDALTIGFARRFATYKRGTLLLKDPQLLESILNDADRPVQIIYAGKAHPQDDEGKALIREIIQLTRRPEFRKRIVFLEDYDAVVSRYMVEGVDVWLNTPRRPMEASGTSGMKAAFNGALNLSIMDGWWDEAYSPRTGWAIGCGEDYQDLNYQDQVEAGSLYELLKEEVVPLFYDRERNGIPTEWIELMKTAMTDLLPAFNTNRMLQQYVVFAYHPARDRAQRLMEDDFAGIKEVAQWRERVESSWKNVKINKVEVNVPEDVRIGSEVEVKTWIDTGGLRPEEIAVQAYLGTVNEQQTIVGQQIISMSAGESDPLKGTLFWVKINCTNSGQQGVTVRVLPYHPDQEHPHCASHIIWAP